MAGAAPLWFTAQQCVMNHAEAVRAAGIDGDDDQLADALFDAIIESRDGVVFTRHDYDDSWSMLKTPDRKIHLDIPELVSDLAALSAGPTDHRSADYPFILSAGERRSFTANTIMRDPSWRKRDPEGALRLSPADAAVLGVDSGSRVRIVTPGGSAVAVAEINDTMMEGHVSLPNGLGLDYSPAGGNPEATGVSPNELTTTDWRDPYAGTPWHKHVPARLEPVT
jgi:anaerobic selenocysteine-containing dehydrogenase